MIMPLQLRYVQDVSITDDDQVRQYQIFTHFVVKPDPISTTQSMQK